MKNIVVGNLKMNLVSPAEREKYLEWMKKELVGKKLKNTEFVLCPPFIHLESFQKALGKKIAMGAQDCSWLEKGSLTGEISPLMLKNLGCQYVILGHSERRNKLGETDAIINQKMLAALKVGLRPILCVGEKMEERKSGRAKEIIEKQFRLAFQDIKNTQIEKIVIAYEPVWAVGSDNVPTSNEIMEAKIIIRKILLEMFGKKYALVPRILYGGSVSSRFVKVTCIDSEMDGALIGRESLLPNEFIKIGQVIDSPR